MRQALFCYGTLTAPALFAAVIGRRATPIPATLSGQRCALLRGRHYPGIWPDPAAQVHGCCYLLHHRRELSRLDRYEGAEYRRLRVTVSTPQGTRQAWAYTPRGGQRRRGAPWSAQAFSRRRLRRELRRATAWRRRGVAANRSDDA